MSRKIYNYENLEESKCISSLKNKKKLYPKTISAAGCLFYNKKTQSLLLISYADKNWPNYDDFGGTVIEHDNTIFETIQREVSEETNGHISEIYMRKLIKSKNYKTFYNETCKYFFLVANIENEFEDTSIFGNYEETDNILRTVSWIKYTDALPKLSIRLKNCNELITFLNTEFKIQKKGFPMGF